MKLLTDRSDKCQVKQNLLDRGNGVRSNKTKMKKYSEQN